MIVHSRLLESSGILIAAQEIFNIVLGVTSPCWFYGALLMHSVLGLLA
jgi:hypothetical protein